MCDQVDQMALPDLPIGGDHGSLLGKRPKSWKRNIMTQMTNCPTIPVSGMCQCPLAHPWHDPRQPGRAIVVHRKETPLVIRLRRSPCRVLSPLQNHHRGIDRLPELPPFKLPHPQLTRLLPPHLTALLEILVPNRGHWQWQSSLKRLVC